MNVTVRRLFSWITIHLFSWRPAARRTGRPRAVAHRARPLRPQGPPPPSRDLPPPPVARAPVRLAISDAPADPPMEGTTLVSPASREGDERFEARLAPAPGPAPALQLTLPPVADPAPAREPENLPSAQLPARLGGPPASVRRAEDYRTRAQRQCKPPAS